MPGVIIFQKKLTQPQVVKPMSPQLFSFEYSSDTSLEHRKPSEARCSMAMQIPKRFFDGIILSIINTSPFQRNVYTHILSVVFIQ